MFQLHDYIENKCKVYLYIYVNLTEVQITLLTNFLLYIRQLPLAVLNSSNWKIIFHYFSLIGTVLFK